MRSLLLLALAASLAGAAPHPSPAPRAKTRPVKSILAAMERAQRDQRGVHPLEARALEGEIRSLSRELRRHGSGAVRPLSAYLRDKKRPLKIRLYAAAALGLIGDLRAMPTLRARARDAEEDPGLRSGALQSLGTVGLPAAELRPLLEEAAREGNPEPLRREAFAQLAWIGTRDLGLAEKAAKRFGAAPSGPKGASAMHAVASLGRSRLLGADEKLFKLVRYFRAKSAIRSKALGALTRRLMLDAPRDERLRRTLTRGEIETLAKIPFEEEGPAALQAARLLGWIGDKRATPRLARLLKAARDPELLAEAAQALSAIGDPKGKRAVLALAGGLVRDQRFRPAEGRPDPRQYALRIQRAADAIAPPTAAAPIVAALPASPPSKRPGRRSLPPPTPVRVPPPTPGPAPKPIEPETFRFEGWPGSGRPVPAFNGRVKRIKLRAEPDRRSRIVAKVSWKKDERIAFDGSMVVTRAPGRVRASRAAAFDGRVMGALKFLSRRKIQAPAVRRTLSLKAGDTLEVLAYRGKGRCFVRHSGEVLEAPCPQNDRENFSVLEKFEVDWWLHVSRLDGAAGWFHSEEPGVDFLSREF